MKRTVVKKINIKFLELFLSAYEQTLKLIKSYECFGEVMVDRIMLTHNRWMKFLEELRMKNIKNER